MRLQESQLVRLVAIDWEEARIAHVDPLLGKLPSMSRFEIAVLHRIEDPAAGMKLVSHRRKLALELEQRVFTSAKPPALMEGL